MRRLCWTDLPCQPIELVGKRHAVAALQPELAFTNHVHESDTGQDCSSRAKRFKAKHRSGDAFNGTVILHHDIVEVFDLPNLDRDFSLRIQPVKRCLVGATVPHGFVEEAPGRCESERLFEKYFGAFAKSPK